jgi:hypothetical protein
MLRRPQVVEVGIACFGAALVVCAAAASQRWLDRHFLPDFFVARATLVRIESAVRLTVAAIGVLLALLRRPLARLAAGDPARTLSVMLAIAASFCAAEVVLRRTRLRAKEEVSARKEPLRRPDARLGWLFVPSRAGYQTINGRRIEYAFDCNGYRVRRTGDGVDFDRPTILFSGESMMVGEKVSWEETIPARTAAILNVQSANLAVSGFATDQAYLRLMSELPRFRRPLAAVTLFSPALFDRNLDDDRPHLGGGLRWFPAEERWRLATIARRLLRYRRDDEVERGIAVTREVLRAGIALARARGAVPLVVVPRFGEEEPRERALRIRILDDAGVPYVEVPLPPAWRVAGDGHPDPRAARAIAAAVAGRLAFFMQRNAAHETPPFRPPVRRAGVGLPALAGAAAEPVDGGRRR